MHKWAKEIIECVKTKVNAKGLDNLNSEEVEELGHWTEVAKNIAEYDYYFKIVEAMEKPENEYGVNYDENGKFYTPPRNSMGQFRRRGYMYEPDLEHYRDMDESRGRMYYTDSNHMGNYSESRYERARRGYEESKQLNPNKDNMKSMEQMFDAFEEEMMELQPKMTPNEKSIARNKLSNMSNMLM